MCLNVHELWTSKYKKKIKSYVESNIESVIGGTEVESIKGVSYINNALV